MDQVNLSKAISGLIRQQCLQSAALRPLPRGAVAEIARRMGVDASLVSRVARGLKTSERVRVGIVQYVLEGGTAPQSAGPTEHGQR